MMMKMIMKKMMMTMIMMMMTVMAMMMMMVIAIILPWLHLQACRINFTLPLPSNTTHTPRTPTLFNPI